MKMILIKGRVVLMASLGGRVAADNLGAYCMTKSAVISFSDTLRRELRKFKIKVVTIEPSVFKTAMFYSFGDSMEKNWKNTEESIKQIYGEKYFEEYSKRFKKDGKGFGAAPGKDLDPVIDDVMKAITSPNPNRFYRPVNNKINGFLAQFIEFVPQFIIDKYFCHMNDVTPEYMLEK